MEAAMNGVSSWRFSAFVSNPCLQESWSFATEHQTSWAHCLRAVVFVGKMVMIAEGFVYYLQCFRTFWTFPSTRFWRRLVKRPVIRWKDDHSLQPWFMPRRWLDICLSCWGPWRASELWWCFGALWAWLGASMSSSEVSAVGRGPRWPFSFSLNNRLAPNALLLEWPELGVLFSSSPFSVGVEGLPTHSLNHSKSEGRLDLAFLGFRVRLIVVCAGFVV